VRFRIINTSAIAVFNFAIDQHKLTVIEIDGSPIEPKTVDYIRINAGQRYDLLVQATQDISNYWIQATIDQYDIWNVYRYASWPVRAVFRYEGAPNVLPDLERLKVMDLQANYSFQEAYFSIDQNNYYFSPPGSIPHSTRQIPVNIDWFVDYNSLWPHLNNVTYGFVNGTTLPPPRGTHRPNMTSPDLFFYTTALNFIRANLSIPPQQNSFTIYNGEVIDFIINNHDNSPHPMHIHGHNFWVLAMGNRSDGDYVPGKHKLNTVNPVKRDTVTANANSFLVMRFVADNPGIWFVHCHTDWHLVSGMAMLFLESPKLIQKQYGMTEELKFCDGLM
jgi:iron transport multicopper oxidase